MFDIKNAQIMTNNIIPFIYNAFYFQYSKPLLTKELNKC